MIVVDGLALDQWVSMRQLLSEQNPSFFMRESATFAWIPTLTSVSRQAIFAGKAPRSFVASIDGTTKEPALWRQFWGNIGLARSAIAYKKGLGAGNVAEILEKDLSPGRTQILGFVVDKVDKIMHGMQLGSAGMHNQIQQWLQSGFLSSLIGALLDSGYQLWLTSDHGNIECSGQGRISEGVLAENRGERVRIYSAPELRSSEKGELWTPIGLPEEYYPLLAKERSAFITSGAVTVAHGGASLEEVIVPFVKFERKETPSSCGRRTG
ncbi:MAG: BREX-3 system phosphatase PglZ [bacterium]|nr:BREX-3 system phosphatase PglZ [bacterium]